jgi:tetratricopeptide (TPR) repeat protein
LYYADAVQSFERAVEIDPAFAAAHLYLGLSHSSLGNIDAMNEAIETARRFAEKATERERLLIEGSYAQFVERDYEKALRILHVMRDKFPREKQVPLSLGNLLWQNGRTEEAIAAWNRALELDPNDGLALNQLAYAHADLGDLERALEYAERYASVLPGDANPLDTMAEMCFRMGRLDEAIARYEEALAIKPDFRFAEWGLAYVHALREDYSEAMRRADRYVASAPSPSAAGGRHARKAFLHFWLGDSESALRELETAQALARAAGHKFWEDEAERARAWMYYYMGEPERGRVFFEDWVCAADEPSYHATFWHRSAAVYEFERSFYLGLADLREGRIASARSRLVGMESRASEEGLRFRNWIPLLRDALHAQVLLEEGSLDEAVKACEEAPVPGGAAIRDMVPYNVLFMRDALACAYVRNGELDKAIAEYERLLTFDPESSDRRLIHPTYHYRLAKLYEEKGQTAKATSEYERFLEIWKDADEGRPEVIDARTRLAALSGA